ncbi:MAG: polysaccharide biosynthesis C-terminal domain-containing protein, partial [Clostridia bacterium]|nr:polysaccharide biosynthesis C-terminal domain-containing protein [Clostridia bacterium]
VAALTNIALDLLFVLLFHWGIAGAAVATLIAQLASCVFCFLNLRKIDILKIEKRHFRASANAILHLLGLGTPMCLQNGIIAVGGMIIQMEVNRFGLIFLAGFTASNKLFGILEIAGSSFGFALVSYVGQNLGAKNIDRIRKGVFQGALLAIATSIVIGVCMLIFGKVFISCFISGSPDQVEQAMDIAYRYLATMSIALPSLYILHAYRSSLQGLGDTVMPMLLGILELFLRVGLVFTLPKFMGSDGIFVAEVSAWIGAAVMLTIVYYIRQHALAKNPLYTV